MSTERKFKKGERIFSEGDQLTHFHLLQSGKVSIFVERGGQRTEVDQPQIGHVIGEQGVFGFPRQVFNAEAVSEVKVIEFPMDPIKTVFEKSPAPYKLFVKALGDELRRLRGIIRGVKMEQESVACPPRFIPRLCAILVLVAKHIGQKPKVDPNMPAYKREEEAKLNPTFKDTDIIVSFHALKIFTSRMFLESHQRMQGFLEIMHKLGYVHLRYEKNEETELMELQEIRVHDFQTIEMFGEFYQHNFFKAGKSEVIIVDKTALQIAGAFCAAAQGQELDRHGVVKLPYKPLMDSLKAQYYIELKEVHFGLLEKKGLYVKRQSVEDQVFISFDLNEWSSMFKFWRILQEIDRWNETGHVNMNENLNEAKVQGPAACPSCASVIKVEAKFCPECGQKLNQAA